MLCIPGFQVPNFLNDIRGYHEALDRIMEMNDLTDLELIKANSSSHTVKL